MRTVPISVALCILDAVRAEAEAHPDPGHPDELERRDLQMWALELRT